MLKDGDPHEIVEGGKVATALLDRCDRYIIHPCSELTAFSFGQTPWLMDISWHITGMGPFKQLQALAASMVHTRMKNVEKIKVKDIMHYLVSSIRFTGHMSPLKDTPVDERRRADWVAPQCA